MIQKFNNEYKLHKLKNKFEFHKEILLKIQYWEMSMRKASHEGELMRKKKYKIKFKKFMTKSKCYYF